MQSYEDEFASLDIRILKKYIHLFFLQNKTENGREYEKKEYDKIQLFFIGVVHFGPCQAILMNRLRTRAFIPLDNSECCNSLRLLYRICDALLCDAFHFCWASSMLLIEKYLINVISSKNNATCKWKWYYCIELAVVKFYPHVCTRNIHCFDWLRWLGSKKYTEKRCIFVGIEHSYRNRKKTQTHTHD